MGNKILLITATALIVIGFAFWGYTKSLDRFTDETAYNEKYIAIDSSDKDASEQFHKLRDQYLTSKFDFENFGFTFITTGFVLLIAGLIGLKNLQTPPKKYLIVLIGLVATIVTCTAYVGDLFLEMDRGSYPHWADSLAIPLMSIPAIMLMLLIWTGIILIGIRNPFATGVKLFPLQLKKTNKLLLIILILTVIILISVICVGYFWMVLPGFLWGYFYLSILLGRRKLVEIDRE
ncbi:MAG TPA: hypothetical protein VFP20_07725 [Bacteroidales bacterium]|nr:hypothetical protein [Bacteroidales bacterium]